MRICIPRPDRPKADRPVFVQLHPGAPRPDPRAGRWASPAQAAEAVGWSRGAVAEAIAHHPHLAVRVDPPPVGGPGDATLASPVLLVDLDRLGRMIGLARTGSMTA